MYRHITSSRSCWCPAQIPVIQSVHPHPQAWKGKCIHSSSSLEDWPWSLSSPQPASPWLSDSRMRSCLLFRRRGWFCGAISPHQNEAEDLDLELSPEPCLTSPSALSGLLLPRAQPVQTRAPESLPQALPLENPTYSKGIRSYLPWPVPITSLIPWLSLRDSLEE